MYRDGTLRLIYTGGARCHNDKFEPTTVIDFVCGVRERGEGEPVFITEDANCTYFLSWHTDLACSSEVSSKCLFILLFPFIHTVLSA